jgi:hypothetical protein
VYDFALMRLSDANREGKAEQVAEVIRVLTPLREAWSLGRFLDRKDAEMLPTAQPEPPVHRVVHRVPEGRFAQLRIWVRDGVA